MTLLGYDLCNIKNTQMKKTIWKVLYKNIRKSTNVNQIY